MSIPSSYSVPEIASSRPYPYIDFVSMSTKTNNFDSSGLIRESENHYILKSQYRYVDIFYNQNHRTLNLRGSLAWFTQGHNLSFSNLKFKNTISDLSLILDVDMVSAGIRSFELGTIVSVDFPVKEYQDNHFDLKSFERVQKQDTLYYNRYTKRGRRYQVLKIYDVVANAKKKKMTFVPEGYQLKYEVKLFNPSKHFNQAISISDILTDSEIINKTYTEMKSYYNQIEKSKHVILPDKPSTEDLLIGALSRSSKEPMKEIDRLINSSKLGTQGRYRRRKLLRQKLDALTIQDSKYDIESLL